MATSPKKLDTGWLHYEAIWAHLRYSRIQDLRFITVISKDVVTDHEALANDTDFYSLSLVHSLSVHLIASLSILHPIGLDTANLFKRNAGKTFYGRIVVSDTEIDVYGQDTALIDSP